MLPTQFIHVRIYRNYIYLKAVVDAEREHKILNPLPHVLSNICPKSLCDHKIFTTNQYNQFASIRNSFKGCENDGEQ